MIKISVLHTELESFVEGKSGFSLLIEADNLRLLLDLSFHNQIESNLEKNDLKLPDIDYLIFSHGHDDHILGIECFDLGHVRNIIAHPRVFEKRYYPGEGMIGCPMELSEIKKTTNVILSKDPFWISNNIVFLGEVPRRTNFEGKESVGYLENGFPDYVLDDTSIAIKTDKGLVIISGCSHSGICNIIEYAKRLCNEEKIKALIGGFHLFEKDKIDKTIEYIKKQNIEVICPMHCLSDYAFSEFEKVGAKRLFTLDEISIN